jgi:hypothetical protein
MDLNIFGWWRHAPAHHHHLLRVTNVADHGRGAIGEDARHGCEVADIAVHAPEKSRDRGLVRGDTVEVAHPLFNRMRDS